MEANSQASGLQSAKAIIELPQGQQPTITSQRCTKLVHLQKVLPVPTTDKNSAVGRDHVLYCNHVFKALYALSVAIVGHMDMLVDRLDFSNEGYCFAAYHQHVWKEQQESSTIMCHMLNQGQVAQC